MFKLNPPHMELKMRFEANQNLLACFTGPTGSGKSYAGIRVYENWMNYKKWKMDIKHIVIGDGAEFIELLSAGLPSHSVVLFDEAGVGLPAREFQSISNKVLGYILETFRRDQIAVIFTTPDFSFFDIKARKLMHIYGEMLDPNTAKVGFGWQKFMKVINNPRGDDYIFMYPTYWINGEKINVRPSELGGGNVHYEIPHNKAFLELYEQKKKKFVDDLKDKALYELRKAQRKPVTASALRDIILEEPIKFGLGFIRMREGLLTQKSLFYLVRYIQGQFSSNEELMKKNLYLTKDIIEQAILLATAEIEPPALQALALRQMNPNMTLREISDKTGVPYHTLVSIAPKYKWLRPPKERNDKNAVTDEMPPPPEDDVMTDAVETDEANVSGDENINKN